MNFRLFLRTSLPPNAAALLQAQETNFKIDSTGEIEYPSVSLQQSMHRKCELWDTLQVVPWEENRACFLISQMSLIRGGTLTCFNCSKDRSWVALRKSLIPPLHFPGSRSSVERGFSMYVVGSMSSIITKPRLRTLSCLLSAVVIFRIKDSPIFANKY